jgi:hypothetical protein
MDTTGAAAALGVKAINGTAISAIRAIKIVPAMNLFITTPQPFTL